MRPSEKREIADVVANREIDADDVFSASASDEFERRFEESRHSKRVVTEVTGSLHSLIFSKKGEETEEDILAITEYITGAESQWCSKTSEVEEFRKALSSSFAHEWKEFQVIHPLLSVSQAMRFLPQCFCLPPLQKTQLEMLTRLTPSKVGNTFGLVLLRIWYIDLAGCTCSSLREFPFDTTASEAIKVTMERLFSVTNFDREKGHGLAHIFRIQGRNDFVYGGEKLIDFRYIRDCITQQREINLVVEPCDQGLLMDPIFIPSYNCIVTQKQNCQDNSYKDSLTVDSANEISIWDINARLEIQVAEGLKGFVFSQERAREENVREGDVLYVAVLVEVCFGAKLLSAPKVTKWVPLKDLGDAKKSEGSRAVWGNGGRLAFDVRLSDAPREVKLCVSLMATTGDMLASVMSLNTAETIRIIDDPSALRKGEEQSNIIFVLGSASIQLFDFKAQMRSGKVDVALWNTKQKANHIGVNSMNREKGASVLSFIFPSFPNPVVIPGGRPPTEKKKDLDSQVTHNNSFIRESIGDGKVEQLRQLKRILGSDPLTALTSSDEALLWKYREELVRRPKALAKFLLAVNWMRPYAVYEAHCLLEQWAPLQPIDALELLDARYADTIVREHAIKSLENMRDYELRGCLLQLIQVLKHEPYHCSAVARFLLRRSLQAPHMIGHYVFWCLVSEMGNESICERHGLLLEELVRRMPERRNYLRQLYVADQLFECAMVVKDAHKKGRINVLREHLKNMRLPSHFTLPLDPAMECNGLDIGKCKVMDSKKSPLWLVFRNSHEEGEPFNVIFKAGDDLRQDLFTLQLLELMDAFWQANGLHLHIIPYRCVATREGVGMIEVVLNSDTIANITRKDGGAHAAFNEEPLMNWLRQYNRERHEVERCLWNFLYSVAGYTVATYVLGIGDRHNDNIMLRQDGNLFHIDYGHFLGNFKTKFGIKRETAPFIFTPMYAYMLGGQSNPIYLHFVDVACHAFNVIRRFSGTLMILFVLMLSTGIPELQRVEDIEWLRSVLLIDRPDEEAMEHYKMQISLALTNVRTRLNDYIHIMAH